MDKENVYNLKFPVGEYIVPDKVTKDHIRSWMLTIEEYPTVIQGRINNLTEEELNWHYRPGGWTIGQVVHHLADSHMNSMIRFKLALTEDFPEIKPYHENLWAELPDYDAKMIDVGFNLLKSVHAKWYKVLQSMNFEDYNAKGFFHPESKKKYTLGEALGMYDWHCRHHGKHISQAIQYKGQFE